MVCGKLQSDYTLNILNWDSGSDWQLQMVPYLFGMCVNYVRPVCTKHTCLRVAV